MRNLIGSLVMVSAAAGVALAAGTGKPAAAPSERRMYADSIDASSFLWNDWNKFQENYHPNYALDGDPSTAWVEGAKGNGEGSWIRFTLGSLDGTSSVRLRLMNGYQKSPALFTANARPRTVTVTLLPSKTKKSVELKDADGWQELTIEQPAGPLEAVEITVDKVYPGKKYEDTCLSDVEIFATATAPQNAALEKGKLDKLLAWKAERQKAAKGYAGLVAQAPVPVLPSYKMDSTSEDSFDYDALWQKCKGEERCLIAENVARAKKSQKFSASGAGLEVIEAVAAGKLTGWAPARVTAKDSPEIPQSDGMEVPSLYTYTYGGSGGVMLPALGTLASLHSEQLGVVSEKKAKISLDKLASGKASQCKSKKGASGLWAMNEKGADGKDRVRGLIIARCGLVEVREGKTVASGMQIVIYDAEGKLELVADQSSVARFTWKDQVIAAASAVGQDGSTTELQAPETVAARP